MNSLEDHGRVYDSVPLPVPVLTSDVDSIRDFLLATKGEWRTSKQIAIAVGIPPKDTNVRVRKAISILIERDGLPIVEGGGSRGYVLAPNSLMVDRGLDRLEIRAKGLQRRIESLKVIRDKMQGVEFNQRLTDRKNGWVFS
jgi:hypothetical protein